MKRRTSIHLSAVVAVVAALTVGAVAAAGPMAGRTTSSAPDDVRKVERALLRATVDADTASVGQILAGDFQLINPLGEADTRKGHLAAVGGGVDFVAFKPTSPIKVRLHGNTAVVRFRAAFEVVAGPDRLKHGGWVTDVFERRQGRWQLVWSQTTAIPNNQGLLIQALKP
jgi:Domain of unknown function (DUF4440)